MDNIYSFNGDIHGVVVKKEGASELLVSQKDMLRIKIAQALQDLKNIPLVEVYENHPVKSITIDEIRDERESQGEPAVVTQEQNVSESVQIPEFSQETIVSNDYNVMENNDILDNINLIEKQDISTPDVQPELNEYNQTVEVNNMNSDIFNQTPVVDMVSEVPTPSSDISLNKDEQEENGLNNNIQTERQFEIPTTQFDVNINNATNNFIEPSAEQTVSSDVNSDIFNQTPVVNINQQEPVMNIGVTASRDATNEEMLTGVVNPTPEMVNQALEQQPSFIPDFDESSSSIKM